MKKPLPVKKKTRTPQTQAPQTQVPQTQVPQIQVPRVRKAKHRRDAGATPKKPKHRRDLSACGHTQADAGATPATGDPGTEAAWRRLCRKHLPGYDPWAWVPSGRRARNAKKGGGDSRFEIGEAGTEARTTGRAAGTEARATGGGGLGAGLWFDVEAALRPVRFFRHVLKHVKGPLAGQPFELADWQKAVVGCLFGWKRADGTRRYREALIYVAKKNGKSAFVAGLVLYVMTQDGELGAELYSAAASRDQAAVIFSHAAGMVKLEPELSRRLTVYGAKGGSVMKSITYDDQMTAYRCLAADANTADGANVHLAAIDELHRHKSPELAEVLKLSTAARSQPLILYTTTADYDRESLCNTTLHRSRAVIENGGHPERAGYDPSFLPVIYECSKDDDWTSPKVWRKANPNLGISIPESFLARECQAARETISLQQNFRRLHLNIVTESAEAFFDMGPWDACCPTDLRLEIGDLRLAGRACFAGLDLSSTRDLTALELVFPPEEDSQTGQWAVLSYFWMPEENIEKRQRDDEVPYRTWTDAGYIETTEGNVVDYDVIRRRIGELGKVYQIREIAIDRWNSTQLQTQLLGDGFEVVPFGQGFASMSAPTKEIEKLIVSGLLDHGGNPVLRWMAGNTVVESDAAANIKPSKKRSSEKIDGIVAAIMAIGRAIVQPEAVESVYEKGGITFV